MEVMNRITTAYGVFGLCGVLFLAGCTVGPDYKRPSLDLPHSVLESTLLDKQQEQALAHWWTRYRDPTLNHLIDEALNSNLNIALQTQKIRQARAELGFQNAQFYPSIQGQAQGMRQRVSDAEGGSTVASGGHWSNYYSIAGMLSYELDFWGALRRADERARAQLLSSAYTKDSVRLQTVADVVANYVSLRALQRQIRVTNETIKTRVKGLHLDQKRYKFGAIDKLTLLQAKTLLDSARAQLPPLEENAAKLHTSLAILTGKTPRQIMSETKLPKGAFKDLTLPQNLPDVLPSALINRRPDIRAAEAELIAANANVGVAKAQFFPTINLSAMIGTQALSVGDLFSHGSEAMQAGGSITAPILDFGRISSQYHGAEAQKQIAKIRYKQTVRHAFQDVRDALNEIKYSNERLARVRQQVKSFQETVNLAELRYKVGRTAFFDVLDAQRQLFSSQLDLANAIRDRFVATADLFKALGGGWTKDTDSLTPEMSKTMQGYASKQGGNQKAGKAQPQ